MGSEISAEQIFTKLLQEKKTGELTPLEADYYSDAEKHLKKLKAESDSEHFENFKKMLISLKQRRRQKLLMYIAYSKPLPAPVPEDEETLYNEIQQLVSKSIPQAKISRIKIKNAIPEVLTAKGKKIGPYKQGDIVELMDDDDAEFLIKNKIGETA